MEIHPTIKLDLVHRTNKESLLMLQKNLFVERAIVKFLQRACSFITFEIFQLRIILSACNFSVWKPEHQYTLPISLQ